MRRHAALVAVPALVLGACDGLACPDPVAVYRDGRVAGIACPADAADAGLTVIDLSADWTPVALAPDDDGDAPAYRAIYLALAAGRYADAGDDRAVAEDDRFLESYGVVPTFAVIAARLADDDRYRCHDAVADDALAALAGRPGEERAEAARARRRRTRALRAALDHQVARRQLPDLDGLAAVSAYYRRQVARLRERETYLAAVTAAQAHLACDGLLDDRRVDGLFTWRTGEALADFQRRHLLAAGGRLGPETRDALREDSRELDFRTALRALRERIVAATGLIEDGSAGAGHQLVLGRRLEPERFGRATGHEPLPGAAPDLIGAATEQAARALGWTDPEAVRRFLAGDVPDRVAIALPPRPAYHAAHMELAAEIDRGDVWYDPEPRTRELARRPALLLYAIDGERRIPLVRWPTTIGGWQPEKLRSGDVAQKWKESPAGARVWRDLYVGPTWLPPASTPDEELVRSLGGGRHALKREAIGPSYRSAYGLVMLIHHVEGRRKGKPTYDDRGVRTHGSANLGSIFDGRSHGCHRLLPPYALRLAGFLLAHRDHRRRGEVETWYRRVVEHEGTFRVEVTTRGYRFELTPPLPVEVLPGRIRSRRKTPPRELFYE